MLLFLLSLLFQPQGIYGVNSGEDFRFCAHRNQTEKGYIYYHVQKDNISIVNGVNLNISAPFPPEKQDNVSGLAKWSLPEPPGSYRFCVYWFRESGHFILSYGGKNYSLSIEANYSLCLPNRTKHSHESSSYELSNVSYMLAKGSNNATLPEASDYQFATEDPAECHHSDLENEVRAVEKQLKVLEGSVRRGNRGRKRVQTAFEYLQQLESKLEEVKFQGHHRTFGEGDLLHASVWKFQSQEPQTLRLKMKEDQEVQSFQVTLPETVLAKSRRQHENNMARAVLLAVSSHQLFQDLSSDQILGGKVVGISLGKTLVRDLPRDQRIGLTFWHNSLPVNVTPQCVFFDMGSKDNPRGKWNTSGCEVKEGRNHTVCLCDHLTFFAVLMVSSPGIDHVHHKYLTLITYIGCIVSAKASLLTIFFLLCLRKKQRDHIIYIHMNLLWAIFLLDMSFLIAVPLAPAGGDISCKAGAMFLHFGLLACLTWMGIEGYNLYQLVIEVFISSVKQLLLKFCLLGWGLPIFIVFLILAIDPSHYGPYSIQVHDSPDGVTNATICWITRREINNVLNLGFLSLVLFFNSIMLTAVVREILRAKQRERPWKYAVMLLGLSCVLGIPWGLAFFSFSSGTFHLVAVYLFTVINSLQGFLIFLWYLAKVMQVRRSSSMQCSTSNSLRPQSSNTSI